MLPVIHVGFPKSASTTIQHGILAHLRDVRYVSRRGNHGERKHWELYNAISQALTTGREVDAAQAAWSELVRTYPTPQLRIFSDERISLPGRHRKSTRLLDRCELVQRIFGPARVFLVIRNPLDYLRSLYQHMGAILHERNCRPPRFDLWLEDNLTGKRDAANSLVQALYFGDMAVRYAELFGKDNVSVHFLEDLKADPERFLSGLQQFIGIPGEQWIRSIPPSRNVTAEKAQIAEIDRHFPGFATPRIPPDYVARALPVIRHQARILADGLGIDALSRWPQLAAPPGTTTPTLGGTPTITPLHLPNRLLLAGRNLWSRARGFLWLILGSQSACEILRV